MKLKEFMKAIDQQVKGKRYAIGEQITLADIALFRHLKYFFQLVFPKGFREKVFPNVCDWFLRVLNTPETDKVYGKVLLCNQPLKPFIPEKKEEEKKEQPKKEQHKKEQPKKEAPKEEAPKEEKKKKNPLDLLPPSKLELEVFKRAFLNNKNKEDAMNKFWEVYDPEGYSLWHLEYQNLPTECKILFRTSNSKSMFLQKCDPLRRYSFAAHGVYGVEDDYKIRGVWMFRGLEIPQEMKDNDLYEYITFTRLDPNKEEDKKLVHDYWTKLDENDEVEGRKCADVSYFN
jgi:elongation factor 1-gamma